MKLPKLFVPDNISPKVKKIVDNTRTLEGATQGALRLLDCFEKYMRSGDNLVDGGYCLGGLFSDYYEAGEMIAKGTDYTKEDLESFVKVFDAKFSDNPEFEWVEFEDLGFCISALVNKIIKKGDLITLEPSIKLHGLGTKLKKDRTLIVYGDVLHWTGLYLKGGNIRVYGNGGDYTGCDMKKGDIWFEGNLENYIGDGMENGIIRFHGDDPGGLGDCYNGEVYFNNIEVWPG